MRNWEGVGGRALLRGAGVAVGAFLGAAAGLAVGLAAILVERLGVPTEPFLLLTLAMFVFPLLGGIVGATVGTIMVGRLLRGEPLRRWSMVVLLLIAASAIPASTYIFPEGILLQFFGWGVVPAPLAWGMIALALGVIVGVVAALVGYLRRFRHRMQAGV